MEMKELPEGVSRITDEHGNPALEFKSWFHLSAYLLVLLPIIAAGLIALVPIVSPDSACELYEFALVGAGIGLLVFLPLFYMRTAAGRSVITILDEKIIFKTPLRCRECLWVDVDSLAIGSNSVGIRSAHSPHIWIGSGEVSKKTQQWRCFEYLAAAIREKCDAVFDERLTEMTAEKGEIAATPPKKPRREIIAVIGLLALIVLALASQKFLSIRHPNEHKFGIEGAIGLLAIGGAYAFWALRRKKAVVVSESGLRISGRDVEHSWTDVTCRKKAPFLAQKSSGLAQALPISITVPGRRFAVTVPPNFVNYNLLDKFLESRDLYQPQEKTS